MTKRFHTVITLTYANDIKVGDVKEIVDEVEVLMRGVHAAHAALFAKPPEIRGGQLGEGPE